jgi:hypothetical protein
MKKLLLKLIDISMLLFVWSLAVGGMIYFVILDLYFPFNETNLVAILGFVSIAILLFVYTRFWIKRWKKSKTASK